MNNLQWTGGDDAFSTVFRGDDGEVHDLSMGVNLDVGSNILLDCDERGNLGGLLDYSGDSFTDRMDVGQAFDSFFSALGSDGFQMDLLDSEASPECTSEFGKEFGDSSANYLTELVRQKEGVIQTPKDSGMRITEDDFEEEERAAFVLLRDFVLDCYEDRVTANRRKAAIEWTFTPLSRKITFDLCCRVLGIRQHVLRTRIHYEFFLRWIQFQGFPFMTVPVPDALNGELWYHYDKPGADVARQAWLCPGAPADIIIQRLAKEYPDFKVENTIADMETKGYVSLRMNAVYLTGRNPERVGMESEINRKKRRNGFWSSYW